MIKINKGNSVWASIALHLFFILNFSSDIGSQSGIEESEYRFLFLGHIYDWSAKSGDKVDERVEQLDLSSYDGFWLGGDVCANTMLNPQTITYLDKLFNLKNPNTHFVLGNHDYRDHNLDVYFEATGRPDYYSTRFMSLMITVLNTNLNSSDCENLNAQYRMLEETLDTLEDASHYILLMHHQIFRDINGIENFKSNGICKYYSMNCDRPDSYFHKSIYPKLVELESKGIEVLIVVGDSGWDKGSHQESDDGVSFIASGINNSYYKSKAPQQLSQIKEDLVLEFLYKAELESLVWQFKSLNGLAGMTRQDWLTR